MKTPFGRSPGALLWALAVVAAVALAATVVAVWTSSDSHAGAIAGAQTAGSAGGGAQSGHGTSTAPSPPPLAVAAVTPAPGAAGVNGAAPVVFSTNQPVDTATVQATVSPSVSGTWTTRPGALVFTPAGAFPPSTKVTISLSPGVKSTAGATTTSAVTTSFTTSAGSVLRLQQLLAVLGYLPVDWTASGQSGPSGVTGVPAAEQAVFDPPAGAFSWAWKTPPPSLASQWSEGGYTVMVKGAVMAFEADHGLAVDGIAGPAVWGALLGATDGSTLARSTHGYTYALATKVLPETLTVWHDGTLLASTRANTGIPAAPTADGTFPVYERLATQVMKGKNPNGTPYADPVAWVAYFNGGDAVHYIARASYGYPQSLGCVEVPYQAGKDIWPYLTIGTLVTVAG